MLGICTPLTAPRTEYYLCERKVEKENTRIIFDLDRCHLVSEDRAPEIDIFDRDPRQTDRSEENTEGRMNENLNCLVCQFDCGTETKVEMHIKR